MGRTWSLFLLHSFPHQEFSEVFLASHFYYCISFLLTRGETRRRALVPVRPGAAGAEEGGRERGREGEIALKDSQTSKK